jgi:ribosome biogenesis GTPase
MPKRVLDVKELDTVDPVAVGDHVTVLLAADGTGTITEIEPRRNKLSRPATDGARRFTKSKPREQVIVANVDQIVVVIPAANPAPSWDLLDRYLATAEASDVPALICFTKADLLADDLSHEIELYRQIGYQVILTSAVSSLGIDEVKAALQDRLSVLGQSGVGKTSVPSMRRAGPVWREGCQRSQ